MRVLCHFRRARAYSLSLGGVWLLGIAPASAQEPHQAAQGTRLTLDAAMKTALNQHALLKKAEAQRAVAEARTQQARSGQQPALSLQGVASKGPTGAPAFGPLNNPSLNGVPPLGVSGMAGDPVKKQFGGGLNLTQNLYDAGRTHYLTASRGALVDAQKSEVAIQQASLLLAVQQSYFSVLRAQRLDTIQRENLRQRETTAQQAKVFADSGLKSGVDALLAQANVAEAKGLVAGTQNEIQSAFAQLNNAMGETSLKRYTLTSPQKPKLPESLEAALGLAKQQRPELVSLAQQVKAADGAVASLKSELKLRVDGIVSVGAVNPGTLIRNNQNVGAAVALTLPLNTGGVVEGRVKEEEYKREALLAQQRDLLETVQLQVTRAWLDVQTREAQVSASQAQQEAAEAALKLAQERYRLQLNTLIELTDAEAQVLRAKIGLAGAEEALLLAQATLRWSVGSLAAQEGAL